MIENKISLLIRKKKISVHHLCVYYKKKWTILCSRYFFFQLEEKGFNFTSVKLILSGLDIRGVKINTSNIKSKQSDSTAVLYILISHKNILNIRLKILHKWICATECTKFDSYDSICDTERTKFDSHDSICDTERRKFSYFQNMKKQHETLNRKNNYNYLHLIMLWLLILSHNNEISFIQFNSSFSHFKCIDLKKLNYLWNQLS